MKSALIFGGLAVAEASHWAVIVAGSQGYGNYRHQADACHAYQLMKTKGVPEDQIILFAVDDVANNSENPFPGKLYNKPDPTGPGVDVYEGCKIDYKGSDVNVQTYLDVITGKGSGKVLKSTESDNVFMTFIDHGAPGLVAFPSTEMHKAQLTQALQTMADQKMFKKLVYYLEACESGSMFEDVSIPNVYAVTAANAQESSWGTYCGDDAKVNGKNIGSCLGDLFSVSWMEDSDSKDTTSETLGAQYTAVKTLTSKSHVLQFSDTTFLDDDVSMYIGDQNSAKQSIEDAQLAGVQYSAREADLKRAYYQYTTATSSTDRLAAGKKLEQVLEEQVAVEKAYTRFLEIVYPGDAEKQSKIRNQQAKAADQDCEMAAHAAFRVHGRDQFDANSGFALQFHQWVVNVCADVSATGANLDVTAAAAQACTPSMLV